MDAVEVKNLTKQFKISITENSKRFGKLKNYFFPRFDRINAVDALSFSISPGECVAFVGPNGAGKSTTIKMLTGIMCPTSGSIAILGKDPRKKRKELSKQISVLFGHCSKLWFHLPVMESFSLLASIYEIPMEEYKKRRDNLIELFEIAHLVKKPVRQLSLGERMRCELVASFLHNPKIIFLDEPTIGLDITAKATIRDLLKSMCKDLGCTLLLTSHDTDDIEMVCDRMILIKNGKCLVDDSVFNVKNNYQKKKIITLILEKGAEALHAEGMHLINASSYQLKYEIDLMKTTLSDVIAKCMQSYDLRDITIEGPSLESIITTFYTQKNK